MHPSVRELLNGDPYTNVLTSMLAERINRAMARRTDSSSSTI